MESLAVTTDLSSAPQAEKSIPESQPLEPWGRLVSGEPGVSASRIAQALGVSATLIKRLAQPLGKMKIPCYYSQPHHRACAAPGGPGGTRAPSRP